MGGGGEGAFYRHWEVIGFPTDLRPKGTILPICWSLNVMSGGGVCVGGMGGVMVAIGVCVCV